MREKEKCKCSVPRKDMDINVVFFSSHAAFMSAFLKSLVNQDV